MVAVDRQRNGENRMSMNLDQNPRVIELRLKHTPWRLTSWLQPHEYIAEPDTPEERWVERVMRERLKELDLKDRWRFPTQSHPIRIRHDDPAEGQGGNGGTDYLYFVATGDGSGAHRFAETFDEHQENIQRAREGQ
jgi:hypothetical protein